MKPEYLSENPKISLVAPSFGCTTRPYKQRLKAAMKTLENEGAILYEGPNIFLSEGVVSSNTPEKRAEEIMDAFRSDSEAVISVGGGETMFEMMEYIDFDIIRKNPKWYVGFSDNTNLTYTITTICDMETIYGSNAPSFYKLQYDSKDTWEMLHGKKEFKGYKGWMSGKNEKIYPDYEFDKKTKIIPVNYEAPVQGRLIGGCLDILSLICGTNLDHTKEYVKRHKEEGIIFFMECCDLNSIQLRRALLQLKYAGWFDDVSLFVIGRSLHIDDKTFGISMTDTYKDILGSLGKPMLMNVSLGHLDPSLPMRCGGLAEVSYKRNQMYINYKD